MSSLTCKDLTGSAKAYDKKSGPSVSQEQKLQLYQNELA